LDGGGNVLGYGSPKEGERKPESARDNAGTKGKHHPCGSEAIAGGGSSGKKSKIMVSERNATKKTG